METISRLKWTAKASVMHVAVLVVVTLPLCVNVAPVMDREL